MKELPEIQYWQGYCVCYALFVRDAQDTQVSFSGQTDAPEVKFALTNRQPDRERKRQTDRQTERERERQTDRQTDK